MPEFTFEICKLFIYLYLLFWFSLTTQRHRRQSVREARSAVTLEAIIKQNKSWSVLIITVLLLWVSASGQFQWLSACPCPGRPLLATSLSTCLLCALLNRIALQIYLDLDDARSLSFMSTEQEQIKTCNNTRVT